MYDFHTHFIPQEVLTWLKENKDLVHAEWVKQDAKKGDFLVVNGKWGFELKNTFINKDLFLAEQKHAEIKHSVISPVPQLFMYDFPAEITAEISGVYNDSLAGWSKATPKNISALGTIPLNAPEKAALELKRIMNNGLKGAIIGPGISTQMLSDDFFTPLLEEANALKAILFIHPLLSEDPRLKRRMLPNLIGVPWETTICAADLVLSGLIDKYPNVKILFAHGGGFLPYQLGRLDKGYQQWHQVSAQLTAPPSEYIKRFWYDTVLWNPDSLDLLIKSAGTERIVPGSDFPFDLCAWPPSGEHAMGAASLLD
ncbi:amidohydrolase family protein [Peribacillus sp. SCS-155]|uniref:amidohydrolase family protein n=1 Tax=Peribacillus sedimenti TaxID=3115297 RepID=UPI00390662B0